MSGPKILLVEDHPMNRELVTDLLTEGGFKVLEAASAEEGIRLARQEAPALILMDLSLPGMDGLAATRALKAAPETRGIPVVALSAHAMAGDQERALEAGCDGYIAKPIDTRSFHRTVADFLPPAAEGGGS